MQNFFKKMLRLQVIGKPEHLHEKKILFMFLRFFNFDYKYVLMFLI